MRTQAKTSHSIASAFMVEWPALDHLLATDRTDTVTAPGDLRTGTAGPEAPSGGSQAGTEERTEIGRPLASGINGGKAGDGLSPGHKPHQHHHRIPQGPASK